MKRFVAILILVLGLSTHRHHRRKHNGLHSHVFDRLFMKPISFNKFDRIFDDFEKTFDKKIQTFNKIHDLLGKANQMKTTIKFFTAAPKPKPVQQEISKPVQIVEIKKEKKVSDDQKCIEILEKILMQLAQLEVFIENKDWKDLVPLVTEIFGNMVADYECFKNNLSFSLIRKTFNHFITDSKKDCIINHLKITLKDLKFGLEALFARDRKLA